jgi:spermidine synthase
MSLAHPNDLILDYTKAMMSFLLFHVRVHSVACIGLGGGSIPKFIRKMLPEINICVVENSQQVINVARQYFFLPENDERLSVVYADGMTWIDSAGEYDVIMLDAFDGSGVPTGFTDDGFIRKIKNRLTYQGIYIQNLWSNDPQLKSRIKQIETTFDQIALIPTPKGGNIVALAFCKEPTAAHMATITKLSRELRLSLGLDFDDMVKRMRSFQSSQVKKLFT